MVFFTCNSCGTALKKNQVERHMSGCGRFVSCMDCQMEFSGNEFKAHTRCISEAEKYNGPDWKPPSSQNKGERKQFAWVETVNSVLESGKRTLNPKQIGFLNAITKHDNVPRKKPKFMNFVRNVARNVDKYTVESVWDLLEAEWKRQAEANKPPTKPANDATNGNGEVTNGTEDGADGESGNEKSLKRKRKGEELGDENNDSSSDSKKKKKKGDENASTEITEEEEENTVSDAPEEFRWGEIIEQILSSRDDKSISLKKLKKKVFAEYYHRVGDSKGVKTSEDLAKQLNKKLSKKKRFRVIGETVKLITAE